MRVSGFRAQAIIEYGLLLATIAMVVLVGVIRFGQLVWQWRIAILVILAVWMLIGLLFGVFVGHLIRFGGGHDWDD